MRKFGLQVIKLIQIIRYFGPLEGISIFLQLMGEKELHTISSKKFRNKIYLRGHQSDPFIFEQVFCELQYAYPHYEKQNPEWMIDAGANIGMSAVFFATLYPGLNIICIEPDNDNFHLLEKNTASYANIHCVKAALWGTSDKVAIHNKEEFSAGYMVGNSTLLTDENSIEGITIPMLMSKYNIDKCDIIKLDIEGAEKEVFEADTSWLNTCGLLFVELHDWLKPGISKIFFNKMSAHNWITYIRGENIICKKD